MPFPAIDMPAFSVPVEILCNILLLAFIDCSKFHVQRSRIRTSSLLSPRISPAIRTTLLSDIAVAQRDIRSNARGVCRFWRDAVDGDSSLWRTIVYEGRGSPGVLAAALDKSGALPVDIVILFHSEHSHTSTFYVRHHENIRHSIQRCQDIVSVILKIKDRLASLDVYSTCSVQMDVISSAISTVSFGGILSTIGLHLSGTCHPGGTFNPTPLLLNFGSPNLRRLAISHIPIDHQSSDHDVTYLTVLELTFDYKSDSIANRWPSFHLLLSRAVNLEKLSLTMCSNPGIPHNPSTLSLPQLNALVIRFMHRKHAGMFLGALHAPNLVLLSLSSIFNSIVLYRFVRPTTGLPTLNATFWWSPDFIFLHITVLHLCWGTLIYDHASVLLMCVPSLQTLVLHNQGPFRGADSLLSCFFHRSILAEQSRRLGESFLSQVDCPELKYIECSGGHRLNEAYIVACRRRLGYPLVLVGDGKRRYT